METIDSSEKLNQRSVLFSATSWCNSQHGVHVFNTHDINYDISEIHTLTGSLNKHLENKCNLLHVCACTSLSFSNTNLTSQSTHFETQMGYVSS